MSGILLLINKNKKKTDQIINSFEKLKLQTNYIFREYFENIYIKKDNINELLIEFSQDTTEYFYEDKQGNWLAYEGMVFTLHEAKAYDAEELLGLYIR